MHISAWKYVGIAKQTNFTFKKGAFDSKSVFGRHYWGLSEKVSRLSSLG